MFWKYHIHKVVRVSHRFEHTFVVREVHIQVIVELTCVSVVDDLNLVTCGTELAVIDSKRTITCAEKMFFVESMSLVSLM